MNSRPTPFDRFVAQYQYPILMAAFATQVVHHQYIKRTTPAYESYAPISIRTLSFPRPLRAGLAWAVVFGALLTKITLSQRTINKYQDPVILQASQKKQWKSISPETL